MKRTTFLNIGLILGFLCCYTEWGQSQSMFVASAMYEILFVQDRFWQNLTHPIILAGLSGLLILLYCIFSSNPGYGLNVTGLLLPGIVVILFLLAGVVSGNIKMILSTLPYITISFLFFRWRRLQKKRLRDGQGQ